MQEKKDDGEVERGSMSREKYQLKAADKLWVALAIAVFLAFLLFVVFYGLDFIGI